MKTLITVVIAAVFFSAVDTHAQTKKEGKILELQKRLYDHGNQSDKSYHHYPQTERDYLTTYYPETIDAQLEFNKKELKKAWREYNEAILEAILLDTDRFAAVCHRYFIYTNKYIAVIKGEKTFNEGDLFEHLRPPSNWRHLPEVMAADIYDDKSAMVMAGGQRMLIRGKDFSNVADGEKVNLGWMMDAGTMRIPEFHEKYKVTVNDKKNRVEIESDSTKKIRVYEVPDNTSVFVKAKMKLEKEWGPKGIAFDLLAYELEMADGTKRTGVYKDYKSSKFIFVNRDGKEFQVAKQDLSDESALKVRQLLRASKAVKKFYEKKNSRRMPPGGWGQ